MKFAFTASAKRDYKRLPTQAAALFDEALLGFLEAPDSFVTAHVRFPAKYRAKPVAGAKGVWEMTWSFAGPDGRATWEWTTLAPEGAGEAVVAVLIRRIGDHKIFRAP